MKKIISRKRDETVVTKKMKLEDETEALLHDITHDIKNHLMSIKGYMHILSKTSHLEDKSSLYLQKIHEKVNTINDLMDHLNSLMYIHTR